MKGLSDCFAYKITYNGLEDVHKCSALEHDKRTDKPYCIGKNEPKKCSFYQTKQAFEQRELASLKLKIKSGYALVDQEKQRYRDLRSRYGG